MSPLAVSVLRAALYGTATAFNQTIQWMCTNNTVLNHICLKCLNPPDARHPGEGRHPKHIHHPVEVRHPVFQAGHNPAVIPAKAGIQGFFEVFPSEDLVQACLNTIKMETSFQGRKKSVVFHLSFELARPRTV
jgi:hypothetical protein